MTPSLKSVVISFLVLFAVFRLIELFRAKEKRLRAFRRGFWTDLVYWGFTPLVTRVVTGAGLATVVVPMAYLLYGKVSRDLIVHGFGPLSRLPLAVQAVAILILSDFIAYWMHRAFHGRRLWRFHAVHHSSVDLDWLSSVRLHPLNDLLMRMVTALPVLALGFAPTALAGVVPILTFLSIVVHANVDWDWGPFRAVVASPRFHRWHHTDESEARDKNFAGLLPLFDIVFGTYYMPRHRVPTSFGTATPVPPSLPGQLLFPFRRQA